MPLAHPMYLLIVPIKKWLILATPPKWFRLHPTSGLSGQLKACGDKIVEEGLSRSRVYVVKFLGRTLPACVVAR